MKNNISKVFIYKDYLCSISENGMGYLCGYVFINNRHPKRYDVMNYVTEGGIDVHGGITFCEIKLHDYDVNIPGIWIGFDCAHYGDSPSPLYRDHTPEYGTYKDENYVLNEIYSMIEQLGVTVYKMTLDNLFPFDMKEPYVLWDMEL